jgi:hypothetical protein
MVLNAIKPAMQKPVSGSLAVALLCIFLSTDLNAQTDEAADVAATLAICKGDETVSDDEDENQFQPCEQYIDANTEESADILKWMIEEIEDRKNHALQAANGFLVRDEIVQWILVILSLLTTISTAITKGYPKLNIRGLDFAIVPIILSSLIAAVTSINAYYQFDEYRRLGQNQADDLTELQTDINFGLLRHAAERQQNPSAELDEEMINEWQDRLRTIMQRYSARETGNGV